MKFEMYGWNVNGETLGCSVLLTGGFGCSML